MKKLNRYGLAILMFMAFFLPFWLTFGRWIFGSGGWQTLNYIFSIAPFLLILLIVLWALLNSRQDVRESKSIGSVDSLILLALYLSIFLHGVFLVDGGDTAGSANSVAMHNFNMDQASSSAMGTMVTGVAIFLTLCAFVLFTYERASKRALSITK